MDRPRSSTKTFCPSLKTPTLRMSLIIVGTAADVPYKPLIIVMIRALRAGNNLPICMFVTLEGIHTYLSQSINKSAMRYIENQPKNPIPPVARRYIPNLIK